MRIDRSNATRTVLAVAGLIVATAATAETWGKPGLWEETEIHNGQKGDITHVCYTESQVTILDEERNKAAIKAQLGAGCRIDNYKQSSAGMSYGIACPESGGTFRSIFESPTSRRIITSSNLNPLSSTEWVGQWLSDDCGEFADPKK